MRILLLGPHREALESYLRSMGDDVLQREDALDPATLAAEGWDWLVSFGYRHMIRRAVLDLYPERIINLHISLLPWNRGADPNLWSFLEDSPKGVTIHRVDEGLDTGPILAQRRVDWQPGDTLATSYARLTSSLEDLFREVWPGIRSGHLQAQAQPAGGSAHRLKDRLQVEHLLSQGWDTSVESLIRKV